MLRGIDVINTCFNVVHAHALSNVCIIILNDLLGF